MTIGGGIDGAHGEVAFEVWRLDVGGGGNESEHGETEAAEDKDEERDDDAEDELAHEASGGIVAEGRGWALVSRDEDKGTRQRLVPAIESRTVECFRRRLTARRCLRRWRTSCHGRPGRSRSSTARLHSHGDGKQPPRGTTGLCLERSRGCHFPAPRPPLRRWRRLEEPAP